MSQQEAETVKKQRKLFAELMQGVDVMRQQREGKITLRTYKAGVPKPLAER